MVSYQKKAGRSTLISRLSYNIIGIKFEIGEKYGKVGSDERESSLVFRVSK